MATGCGGERLTEAAHSCEEKAIDQTVAASLQDVDISFKIPLPPGYHWEVTQSWGDHCGTCKSKYSDWSYCSLSHQNSCCKYSWDFNLPGNGDSGKPTLASADGTVKKRGYTNGWGNYILIDHGENVCTRYAHLQSGSTSHLEVGDAVCQGLELGTIGESGAAEGAHLHFQFENCSSGTTLAIEFDDGNGVPYCTRGQDVFNDSGEYDFLILSNQPKKSCGEVADEFGGEQLPEGGWLDGQCGNLGGCPLRPDCDRSTDHQFNDWYLLTELTTKNAAYLWSECALDGKNGGDFAPLDSITKAEALKISMYLFDVISDCPGGQGFSWDDLDGEDWYLPIIACAVMHGIVDSAADAFDPNKKIGFAEAAKYAVLPALHAGVIELKDPAIGNFAQIGPGHWGYAYAETLWAYGGIVTNPNYFWPDQAVERREYAAMVAALSPCFCGNVKCDSGCSCNQDLFACVDPNADPGVGGVGDDDQEPDPEDDEPSGEIDVSISCEVKDKWSECLDGKANLDVQCTLINHGDEEIKLSNLKMLPDGTSPCEITDGDLQTGAGLQNIDAGEEKFLYGHYFIECSEDFVGSKIDVKFDLYHKVDGSKIWTYEVDEFAIPYKGYENYCIEEVCVPMSCEQVGAQCGLVDDGCGESLPCGSCADGYICIEKTCIPLCVPGTCESLGYECGLQDDGCGGSLSCGFCEYGKLCSDLGKCYETCAAQSCESLGHQCGLFEDGCGGNLDCGGCPGLSSCNDGQCSYNFSWECSGDEIVYEVTSLGGSFEWLLEGGTEYSKNSLPPAGMAELHIGCDEFPAILLVHGGAEGISIQVDSSKPPFAAWVDYEGYASFTPATKPDMIGHSVGTTVPYSKIMLVMPPP